uniref:Uncharacterized protein n=1 Tax=Onchocerca volvulus TaxID=6282 RepID=A0A8R1XYY3_ONCVO
MFENRLTLRPTVPVIIRFTEYNSFITYCSYFAENFIENQLLDCFD